MVLEGLRDPAVRAALEPRVLKVLGGSTVVAVGAWPSTLATAPGIAHAQATALRPEERARRTPGAAE